MVVAAGLREAGTREGVGCLQKPGRADGCLLGRPDWRSGRACWRQWSSCVYVCASVRACMYFCVCVCVYVRARVRSKRQRFSALLYCAAHHPPVSRPIIHSHITLSHTIASGSLAPTVFVPRHSCAWGGGWTWVCGVERRDILLLSIFLLYCCCLAILAHSCIFHHILLNSSTFLTRDLNLNLSRITLYHTTLLHTTLSYTALSHIHLSPITLSRFTLSRIPLLHITLSHDSTLLSHALLSHKLLSHS